MSKLVFAASLLAVLVLAACSPAVAAPVAPSIPPSPSAPPSADPPPSDAPATPAPDPTPTPTPPARPAPDPTDPPETPDPAILEFTAAEMFLVDGIRPGAAMDCEPVRAELPKKAIAGVECIGGEWFVARLGFYLFENDEEMVEHYTLRMQAEGVTLDHGSCFDGAGDGQYIPGDEEVASRHGCFITAHGIANYRLLLPGAHVYVGIVGHDIDSVELQDFAFLGGTRDTPSFPTIWGRD
jgi:hypothetical protein